LSSIDGIFGLGTRKHKTALIMPSQRCGRQRDFQHPGTGALTSVPDADHIVENR